MTIIETRNLIITLNDTLSLLKNRNLNGFELARCYENLGTTSTGIVDDSLIMEREKIRKDIEVRMEERIRSILILSKTKRMMGDDVSAVQLHRDAKIWIPENWPKGLEVLDGVDR